MMFCSLWFEQIYDDMFTFLNIYIYIYDLLPDSADDVERTFVDPCASYSELSTAFMEADMTSMVKGTLLAFIGHQWQTQL